MLGATQHGQEGWRLRERIGEASAFGIEAPGQAVALALGQDLRCVFGAGAEQSRDRSRSSTIGL